MTRSPACTAQWRNRRVGRHSGHLQVSSKSKARDAPLNVAESVRFSDGAPVVGWYRRRTRSRCRPDVAPPRKNMQPSMRGSGVVDCSSCRATAPRSFNTDDLYIGRCRRARMAISRVAGGRFLCYRSRRSAVGQYLVNMRPSMSGRRFFRCSPGQCHTGCEAAA